MFVKIQKKYFEGKLFNELYFFFLAIFVLKLKQRIENYNT